MKGAPRTLHIRCGDDIRDKLVEAGFACAWLRYRTEVELGYNTGGKMVRDTRQGRSMFNRSPLEYEDEIAIAEYPKRAKISFSIFPASPPLVAISA